MVEYVGSILYDEKLLNKDRKFIIFGAGLSGKNILSYLDLNGVKEKVICFCDSNLELCGLDIEGIKILHTKDVLIDYADADYLVSGRFSKEIYQILKAANIKKIHLLLQ